MNTLIENDGDATRIRLMATNPLEKLALATIGDSHSKGQAVVFCGDGNEWTLELAKVNNERQAQNGT